MDHQQTFARKSIYYVHFPTPIRKTILGFLKYQTILPILRRVLIIPVISSGLKRVDDILSRSGKWMGEENTIILANPPKKFTLKLRFYSESVVLKSLKYIKVYSPNADLKLVDSKIEHFSSTLCYTYQFNMLKDSSAVIKIRVDKLARKLGVGLISLTVNNLRYFFWNLMKKYLPRYEMALYGSSAYNPGGGIDSYDLILANSGFTKGWIKHYWARDAEILYPPVDAGKLKSVAKKRDIILNVGRFFVGGHSKRQDALVKAFKRLVDSRVLDKNWELHLVGGIAAGWEHNNYINELKKLSEGYNIHFHFSASFSKLKELYGLAKIYWHATGYEQSRLRNPVAFEHFGISVVEAMASGCVPIVFRGGGLIEIVGNDSELLWSRIEQLQSITTRVVSNPKLMQKLSKESKKNSEKYSRKNFVKNFLKIVSKISN